MLFRMTLMIVSAILVTGNVSFAADDQVVTPAESSVQSFPYIGEITGDNVYVRSGPGTNYYQCGKLNKAERVKVLGTQYVWSRIVPPAGSFSWIAVKYVSIDLADQTAGTVTGDNVRVWAGSADYKPIHSTTMQGKLNKGDKVKLLGEQQGDYYKIAPPSFAYLWVATEFLKPYVPSEAEAAEPTPVTVAPAEPNEPAAVAVDKSKVSPSVTEPTTVEVKDVISIEKQRLAEYEELRGKVELERTKPVLEQDYSEIKEQLQTIATDQDAGKAARYSEFVLSQIKRYEMAAAVKRQLDEQTAELAKITGNIDDVRAEKLSKFVDLGKFAVVGYLKASNIYGAEVELRHWRVVDEKSNSLCYAVGVDSAKGMDLSDYVDKKVGLVGVIEAHPETSGALVRFTAIELLD